MPYPFRTQSTEWSAFPSLERIRLYAERLKQFCRFQMSRRTLLPLGVLLMLLITCACAAPRPDEPSGPRTLDDDFDGAVLNTPLWNTCHWWNDGGCTIESNDELEWYRAEQVSVTDGYLQLQAAEESTTAPNGDEFEYRSGMVTTGPPAYREPAKFAFQYGTVAARLRVPEGAGLWSALWLLPADSGSRQEIDILEVVGQQPDELIMHLHPADRDVDSPSMRYRMPNGKSLGDGWHDVRLDWRPNPLQWFLDNVGWRYEGPLNSREADVCGR